MRHSVPHASNIGAEPPACKGFLSPIGPRGLYWLDQGSRPGAHPAVSLRINSFKSADYVGPRRAASVSAATDGNG